MSKQFCSCHGCGAEIDVPEGEEYPSCPSCNRLMHRMSAMLVDYEGQEDYCWCSPELEEPEPGALIIIHRDVH